MSTGAPIPAVASPHYAREGSTDVGGQRKGSRCPIAGNTERSVPQHGGRPRAATGTESATQVISERHRKRRPAALAVSR